MEQSGKIFLSIHLENNGICSVLLASYAVFVCPIKIFKCKNCHLELCIFQTSAREGREVLADTTSQVVGIVLVVVVGVAVVHIDVPSVVAIERIGRSRPVVVRLEASNAMLSDLDMVTFYPHKI